MRPIPIRKLKTLSRGFCAATNQDVSAALLADTFGKLWLGDIPRDHRLDLPPLRSLEEALAVHTEMLASPKLVQRLGGAVGWKMGWKGVPRARGWLPEKHALFGPLFGSGVVESGSAVSLGESRIHCAEAEFGLVMKDTLEPRHHTPYSEEEVWDAVSHVELCIELPGARQWESKDPLHYVAG
jgi:2-keto-4-pentenoate hydratase